MSLIPLLVTVGLIAGAPQVLPEGGQDDLGLTLDLSASLTSRPERSMGGTDLLPQIGLRGLWLWPGSGTGWVLGGELALRSFWPRHDGSDIVASDRFQLSTQVGALFGFRWQTSQLGLVPHLSAGLGNDFVLAHLITPGNDAWRPRWLPGAYVGGGIVASLRRLSLRWDVALGFMDGRLEYRFDTGLGFRL